MSIIRDIVKQGFHGSKQWYKCRGCGYQSTQEKAPMSKAERERRMLRGLCLFLCGLSKNAVAKLMNVSCQSVCKWILKLGDPDDFGHYQKLIPESMLVRSKSETVSIEQNNGRQRHWLAAFRRRSRNQQIIKSTRIYAR
jgi:hypothetical protein